MPLYPHIHTLFKAKHAFENRLEHLFKHLSVSSNVRCIVKITGDVTISFPSGIIKVFTSNPSPAVLCFRVKNISRLEQILPNSQLVFRFVCFTLKIKIEVSF